MRNVSPEYLQKEKEALYVQSLERDINRLRAERDALRYAPTTPLTDDAIADVVSSFDGNEDWNLHDFARAVLAAQEARNV